MFKILQNVFMLYGLGWSSNVSGYIVCFVQILTNTISVLFCFWNSFTSSHKLMFYGFKKIQIFSHSVSHTCHLTVSSCYLCLTNSLKSAKESCDQVKKLCPMSLVLYENIDQTLMNKLHGPMRDKRGAACVYNGHVFYTLL